MQDRMTSKRNSRVFTDEAAHHGEKSQPQKHHATNIATTYRSRRNSRSSGRDDSAALGSEPEEEKLKDSLSAMAAAPNKEASGAVSTKMVHTKDLPKLAASVSTESDSSVASTEGRPHNFGVVIPGVYRTSYPKPEHYRFLKELKLKTIVTLVKKDELDHDLQSFVNANGIHQVIFNMKGTKKEAIPPATMKSILQVVMDARNYPLMIHCNHGKHRTGCVVAAVRKIEGWSVKDSIDEYVSYAEPKIRDCDIDYIRDFQPSEMQTLPGPSTRFTPPQVRTFARTLVFSTVVMLLWFVSGSQMVASRNRAIPQ